MVINACYNTVVHIATKWSIERVESRKCRMYTGCFKSPHVQLRTTVAESENLFKSLCEQAHTPEVEKWLVCAPLPTHVVIVGTQGLLNHSVYAYIEPE